MYNLTVDNPNKLFFTSDTHFRHFNAAKLCNRPFISRSDMDNSLIEKWNSVVPVDGIVVHCGDFMLPHEIGIKEYRKYFSKLNFKTLLLLRGNHDRIELGEYLIDNKQIIVMDMSFILVNNMKIFAQHYPMMCYPADCQVFGHIHTLKDGKCHGIDEDVINKLRPTQYDVGVDQNNYTPISYWELCQIFNK